MIYKLYDMNTRTKLLQTPEEQEIVIAMKLLFNKDENSNLLLVKEHEKQSVIFIGIRNKQMFEEYEKEYEYRNLTEKSCVDLKREILGLTKK